jgi:hypothetical protein
MCILIYNNNMKIINIENQKIKFNTPGFLGNNKNSIRRQDMDKIITDGEGNFTRVTIGKNRAITRAEAISVVYGALKGKTVKECCQILGLNYGQVYSVRYGDTHKKTLAEYREKMGIR